MLDRRKEMQAFSQVEKQTKNSLRVLQNSGGGKKKKEENQPAIHRYSRSIAALLPQRSPSSRSSAATAQLVAPTPSLVSIG